MTLYFKVTRPHSARVAESLVSEMDHSSSAAWISWSNAGRHIHTQCFSTYNTDLVIDDFHCLKTTTTAVVMSGNFACEKLALS